MQESGYIRRGQSLGPLKHILNPSFGSVVPLRVCCAETFAGQK
jgi:hypothetical protein